MRLTLRKSWKLAAACACIAAGALMIWIGIACGEMHVVEAKAVRICLECIGIG